MNKPIHQKVILWGAYIGIGIILLGSLLDAISNSISLVTPSVTYWGTGFISIVWMGVEIVLRKRPIQWVVSKNSSIKIKSLGIKIRLTIAGMLLLLWMPTGKDLIHQYYASNWANPAPPELTRADNPSHSDERIKVVVADFDGPDPLHYGVSQIVLEKLESSTKDFPDVEVVRRKQIVSNHDEALKQAKEIKANLIIWGSYLANNKNVRLTINFSFPQKAEGVDYERVKLSVISTLSALESFSIQENMSNTLTCFTLFTIGLTRVAKQDYAKAIDTLTKAIELSPIEQISNPAHLYFYRGYARLSLGQFEESFKDFSTAIEMKPDHGEAYANRAILYARQGDFVREEADTNKALMLLPQHPMVLNNHGLLFLIKGDYEGALADLTKALNIEPLPLTYTNRALVLIQKGDIAAALSDVEKGLTLDPEEASLYIARGAALSIKGDLAAAYASFSEAIRLSPDDPKGYSNRGGVSFKMGAVDSALNDFEYAIKLAPKFRPSYYNRGNLFLELKQYDKAISDLNKAIEIDPNYASSYSQRGVAYSSIKEYQLALKDFDKSLRLDPKDATTYLNRSITLLAMKRVGAAIADLDKAIKLDPRNPEFFVQRCMYNYRARNLDKCISDCNIAVQLNPDLLMSYVNRGICVMRKGNDHGAIKDFSKAIELDPALGMSYTNRGNANKHIGAFDQAEKDFTAGIALSPKEGKLHGYYNRGLFYIYRGDKVKAEADLQQALSLVDDPEFRRRIEEKLKELRGG